MMSHMTKILDLELKRRKNLGAIGAYVEGNRKISTRKI